MTGRNAASTTRRAMNSRRLIRSSRWPNGFPKVYFDTSMLSSIEACTRRPSLSIPQPRHSIITRWPDAPRAVRGALLVRLRRSVAGVPPGGEPPPQRQVRKGSNPVLGAPSRHVRLGAVSSLDLGIKTRRRLPTAVIWPVFRTAGVERRAPGMLSFGY